jgi:hypothetical protein
VFTIESLNEVALITSLVTANPPKHRSPIVAAGLTGEPLARADRLVNLLLK